MPRGYPADEYFVFISTSVSLSLSLSVYLSASHFLPLSVLVLSAGLRGGIREDTTILPLFILIENLKTY